MKIIYTNSGKEALQKYKEDKASDLESLISSKKYVYGDEVVEITAADIEEYSKIKDHRNYTVQRYQPSIYRFANVIAPVYFVVGFFTTFYGFFKQDIDRIFQQNDGQIQIVLAGIVLMLISVMFGFYFRMRSRKMQIEEAMTLSIDRYDEWRNKNLSEN